MRKNRKEKGKRKLGQRPERDCPKWDTTLCAWLVVMHDTSSTIAPRRFSDRPMLKDMTESTKDPIRATGIQLSKTSAYECDRMQENTVT